MQIAEALHVAHRAGIVHVIGSPAGADQRRRARSPARSRPRTDIFALGVVVDEMATGTELEKKLADGRKSRSV